MASRRRWGIVSSRCRRPGVSGRRETLQVLASVQCDVRLRAAVAGAVLAAGSDTGARFAVSLSLRTLARLHLTAGAVTDHVRCGQPPEQAVSSHQLVLGAALDDLATIQHDDLIGAPRGGNPVSDDDRRTAA